MHSHILNSKTNCCQPARLDCASLILPVDLAIILPPPQPLHDVERSASSTLAQFASIDVASLPFATHHCLYAWCIAFHSSASPAVISGLFSNSEINQTSSGFLVDWGK